MPLKRGAALPVWRSLLAARGGSRRRPRRFQPRGRGRDEPSPRRRRLSAHRATSISRCSRSKACARPGAKVSTLPRPAAFRDQEKYTATMLDIAARLIGTTLVLNMGRTDVARELLDTVRTSLSDLRRAERRHGARRLRARCQYGDGRAVRARQGPRLGQRRGRRGIVSRHAAALRRHGAASRSAATPNSAA